MRILSLAGSGVAGICLILAFDSIGAPSAVDGRTIVRTPARFDARVRFGASPAPPMVCSTSYPGMSFVGIAGQGEVAGGDVSAVTGGYQNQACAPDSGIGDGYDNGIGDSSGDGQYAYIGGGFENRNTGTAAFVGDGQDNAVSGASAFVGAGNSNRVSGIASFAGAGTSNTVTANYASIAGGMSGIASGNLSFIGGGQGNMVASGATYGVVSGGYGNFVLDPYATIGGGSSNRAEANFSMIPGGADNEALGIASFAAGYHAASMHSGSFVWSDDSSGSSLVSDTAINQFVVRASGGTTIYSSENLASGVKLAAGSGTWASLSDRNAKTDIVPLDDASILAKVAALPIDAWRYKTESRVRHVGPMAQDFYAAFAVGEDDRHITSIDEDGVALAAIKALHSENGRLHLENGRLRSAFETMRLDEQQKSREIAALRDGLQRLTARVNAAVSHPRR